MNRFLFLLISTVFSMSALYGQEIPENWMNLDASDGYYGISAEKAYADLLKERSGKMVVVAVIDSGVDIEHEDLQGNIWINEDEIPDNGIDDDRNGYIDDVHGWNFIGGPDGKNVKGETLEMTRIYAHLRNKYKDVNPLELSEDDKKEYARYLSYGKRVNKEREKAQEALNQIEPIYETVLSSLDAIKQEIPGDFYSVETLDTLVASEQLVLIGKSILMQIINENGSDSLPVDNIVSSVKEELSYERNLYKNKLDFQWNPDYDSRKEIVKDDYNNGKQRSYGNNDVEGPDALHGTHVAGIIAAVRDNNIGMEGVAKNVKIMSIRAVPDGDERDKDVANAIRYAVDNGASIINMSFGKGQSWDKDLVDDAVKYAVKNDVLLIHAAGNSSQNNDIEENYPNDQYRKIGWFLCRKKEPKTWIEVGALSHRKKSDLVASFSNYGKVSVDIFAPGEAIYSTVPNNEYQYLQGTSMAAPVVAGAAATLRSYFPNLKAEQIKEILLKSSKTIDSDVKVPGKTEMIPFNELSVTGGVVNLYEAVKMALLTKGKKKIEKEKDRV